MPNSSDSPKPGSVAKVVLAYSGGLDTSVILRWLQDHYRCEVVTFTADLGQGEELEPARAKAETMGAAAIFVEDLREEFVRDYVFPMFRAIAGSASRAANSSSTKNGLPPARACSSPASAAGTGPPAIASSWRATSSAPSGPRSTRSTERRRESSVASRRSSGGSASSTR
jgi:hypothetical protein